MACKLRNEYLISYDVEDNKIRKKIFNELEKIGMRSVQKSVFWGFLTKAELTSVHRFIKQNLSKDDKTLITHTNFNGTGHSFLIGHDPHDFQDWEETSVI